MEPDHIRFEHLHSHTVDIRAEMAVMTALLREAGAASFTELIRESESRLVVVVRFLGLLELYRDRDVEFEQDAPLGELRVLWSGPASGEIAALDRAAAEWAEPESGQSPRPAPETEDADHG
nr:segregation/condensation protein A [Nesterenkonia sp. AN1]